MSPFTKSSDVPLCSMWGGFTWIHLACVLLGNGGCSKYCEKFTHKHRFVNAHTYDCKIFLRLSSLGFSSPSVAKGTQ